ncbi:MAG: hypothetical protein AAB466_03295 [Verrucomicrobiota bacterium]
MGETDSTAGKKDPKSSTTALSLEDFNNAIGVNAHRFGLPKINQQTVILWRTDVSGIFEGVLSTVVEADAKGAKRLLFHQTLNLCDFHGTKVASGAEYGKHEIGGTDEAVVSRRKALKCFFIHHSSFCPQKSRGPGKRFSWIPGF